MSIDKFVVEHINTRLDLKVNEKVDKLAVSLKNELIEELQWIKPIEIQKGKQIVKIEGLQHEMTPVVLDYMNSRMPVLLVGQAGTGKTHIAVSCAKILGLEFYSISVNEQTSKSDFLGYKDANGKMVLTNFRHAYEKGGVFIIDEIDAGNPNILTVINSALSNDVCPFADGMVKRHKDFICVCTANTFGEGESMQYIGRNILDSATKDRFATIHIDYSNNLERALIPTYKPLIDELRSYFNGNNIQFVISTRGGIRLETLKMNIKGKITENHIVNTLNLYQFIDKDKQLKDIVVKYV